MSAANRAQASAASEQQQQHNQENVLTRLRGTLKGWDVSNQENQPLKQAAGRTVLGILHNNQHVQTQNQRAAKQESAQSSSCNNDDYGRPCYEKPTNKPFQIHMDGPDDACTKKPLTVAEADRAKPVDSPLQIDNAVTQLRQPLATIELPPAMDVSFESPMDMSVVEGVEKPADVNEVSEYADEIHEYLRELEVKTRPKAAYMKKQPDITNSMRAILVDWLVEVGEEYKLQNETLYLAVNYIDRFLSSMSVLRGKLQLVGTAAMLLAAKFEEIYPPEVAEFVYITDDTYTKKQVLRMEHLVLKVLSFDLAAPTINQFLTQYFLHQPVSKQVKNLAMYLAELSLVDCDPFLKYLPSLMAAAAFTLANHTVAGGSWTKPLVEFSGYSLEELVPCIEDLHKLYLNAPQHAQQSVREKYKHQKYQEVSLIDAPAQLSLN